MIKLVGVNAGLMVDDGALNLKFRVCHFVEQTMQRHINQQSNIIYI